MALVYDSNAELYAAAARKYWPQAAEHLVEVAGLADGNIVLDMACGPASVSLRAARRVAPGGWVFGGDISRGMLVEAQLEAARDGVYNVGFFPADFDSRFFAPASFDAVLCAFAIFLAGDYAATVRELFSLVRPGGVLAISTFAADHYTPLLPVYFDAVRAHSSLELDPLLLAQRIFDRDDLATIFRDAGIPDAKVTYRANPIPIDGVADFWDIVASTGNQRIQAALSPEEAARVRADVEAYARRESVTTLSFGVNYAVATKPV